eukprot:9055388-Alexandrium_andersonii.AAC.1
MASHAACARVPVRHGAAGSAWAVGLRHVDGVRPREFCGRAPIAVHGAARTAGDGRRRAPLQRVPRAVR